MYFFIVAAYVLAAVKWGDWKNWQSYYSTILYFIIGDFAYNFLAYNQPLWEYSFPHLTHTFLDMLYAGIVFPSIVLLFIPYFPKSSLIRQFLYLALWTLIGFITDIILRKSGYFVFMNGWNMAWSVLFYAIMYPMLKLHYHKPLLAWPISITLAGMVLYIFNIPLSSMR